MSDTKAALITPVATLSYPHLDKPQVDKLRPENKPKFSASLVFPKGTDLSAIEARIMEVAEEKFASIAKQKGMTIQELFDDNVIKYPLRRDAKAKGYPEGARFINVRSDTQPGTVSRYPAPDGRPQKVAQDKIAETFYPGAQVRASVSVFSYNRPDAKGVSLGLNNVQFWADGERLAGRRAAEDEFSADLSSEISPDDQI